MDRYLIALICNLIQFCFLWWWFVFTNRMDIYLTNIAIVGIVVPGIVMFAVLNSSKLRKLLNIR